MKLNVALMILFAAGVATVLPVWAFPTQDEIKTATDVVGDLVADDVRAANSGKAKRADVAEKILALVDQAETDAAKWVLYKNAFIQYAKANNFTKAGEVLTDTLAAFPDIPPKTLLSLIERNAGKANAKNAPTIMRIRKLMHVRQKCSGIVASAKASPKEKAEAYCLMGDWKKGLKMFETLGGKTAEMAAAETSGKQPKHVIANYWWDYECALDTCDQFKAHAAEIYKAGLADGSISGLYKNVAEKRIAEMEAVPQAATAPSATKAKGLIHRWSFNNNVRDSIGNSHGKIEGKATYKNNAVVLPGGGKNAGAINLGSKLLPGGKDFTLEIWAALSRIQYWSVIMRLEYPGENWDSYNVCLLTWNIDTWPTKSYFAVSCGLSSDHYHAEANWALGEMYHIVIVGTKNSNGKLDVTYMRGKSNDSELKTMLQHKGAIWPSDTIALWLGRSVPGGPNPRLTDAAATYDEVRIWNRPLTQDELNKSHKAGPDKLF